MSEKRFKLVHVSGDQKKLVDSETKEYCIIEIYDDSIDYFIDWLNSLTGRNKRLTLKLNVEKALCNSLLKENNQLKEEIETLKQKEEVLNKIWRSYLEKKDKKYVADNSCIQFVGDDDD